MIFKNIYILAVILGFAGLASCTSSTEVKEVDTKLDVKGNVDGKQIGLNSDNEAIIQEKTDADDEIRALEWGNTRMLERLETDYSELKRCREDLSDARLGGNGEVSSIPEIDKMKSVAEVKEEFGIDSEGKLTVVKRQKYTDKLAQEQKFQETLKTMQKAISQHRTDCERRMRTARVKAGLPAQRYTAQGYFEQGGAWVETRRAELTIDDGFEIKQRETKKAPKAATPEEPAEL